MTTNEKTEIDTATKTAAVHKYVEAFEKGSLELIREIYAEDAIVEDPVGQNPYVGIDKICGFYKSAFDMKATLELKGAIRCAGNSCAFEFVVNAAGMKISPIDVFEFNSEGKVAFMKAYWSADNMLS